MPITSGYIPINKIWQMYAKTISRDLKTETDVGLILKSASINEKYDRIPTVLIINITVQSIILRSLNFKRIRLPSPLPPLTESSMKHPMILTINPAIPHWDRRRVDEILEHFLLTIIFLIDCFNIS